MRIKRKDAELSSTELSSTKLSGTELSSTKSYPVLSYPVLSYPKWAKAEYSQFTSAVSSCTATEDFSETLSWISDQTFLKMTPCFNPEIQLLEIRIKSQTHSQKCESLVLARVIIKWCEFLV